MLSGHGAERAGPGVLGEQQRGRAFAVARGGERRIAGNAEIIGHRGDVVAVRQEGRLLVMMKRVVGLPGERITIRRGQVMVNDKPLDEPYAKAFDLPSMNDDIVLGPNEYFVIGDNREVSVYFPVQLNEIMGKVVF